jgi:hypothetical protein
MQIKHHLSEQLTTMPKDYELVNEAVESRNKKTVTACIPITEKE